MIAYKFVRWDVEPLDQLKDTFVYKVKQKVLQNKELTRQEKNELYKQLRNNSYSKTGVPLQGWLFDFKMILRTFLIAYKYDVNTFHRVHAIDKTSIRESENQIYLITEI